MQKLGYGGLVGGGAEVEVTVCKEKTAPELCIFKSCNEFNSRLQRRTSLRKS